MLVYVLEDPAPASPTICFQVNMITTDSSWKNKVQSQLQGSISLGLTMEEMSHILHFNDEIKGNGIDTTEMIF